MSKPIANLQDFQEYVAGVFERIGHHAGDVKVTCMVLAGLVASTAEPGSIYVRTYSGKTTNVIWFRNQGREYCLTYDHDERSVLLRVDNMRGEVIAQINDEDLGWVHDLISRFTVRNLKG